MPLEPSTRFGPYEILAPLGQGGMGEVYRARDTRLGREVAIKVLPARHVANAEVRARFEREARTISALNHPHICVLHDVGREGDVDYLVMELIEGETLAQRLARGPLPIPEALRYGAQIADALDRAHRAGVVHRDLKPGNVMLTKSGAKLMDFGLARSTGMGGPASGSGVTLATLTQSPTMAAPLTTEGMIVGTFQYMAPEQLEGKEVDARTDLFSFGLVLYEMVTGRRAFEGRSQASLVAAILEREPAPITSLVPLAPPALERLVGACLAKDPEQRIQTAHDVKLQLQWIAEGGSMAGVPAPVAQRRRSRERLAWMIAAGAALALVMTAGVLVLRPEDETPVIRFTVNAPPDQTDAWWPRLSPDGKLLAFLASDTTGKRRIWIRPLAATEAQPLAGSEAAGRPFWSPDSRYLAFVAEGKLKKIPVAGGAAVLIGDAPGRSDGSWGRGNTILLDGGSTDSLVSVSASGGVPRPATSLDPRQREVGHSWPVFLPDGRHFVFQSLRNGATSNGLRLGTIGSLVSWELGPCDSRPEFAPPHFVIYLREGTLVAQALDVNAHKFVGDPIPVTDRAVGTRNTGEFSASSNGVLAFSNSTQGALNELVWVDRTGRRLAQGAPANNYRDVSLSPDERRAAVGIANARTGNEDIWVVDLERNVSSRLTFLDGNELWPMWSPDGSRVLYASDQSGAFRIIARLASGVGAEDSLAASGRSEGAIDWSRDGQWIASTVLAPPNNWDIWVRRAEPGAKPQPFLATPATERHPVFSPDGRWLAYSSNETGRSEIYVRSFPDGQGKWQVSSQGGFQPEWRADGRELYYLSGDGWITAVPVESAAEFRSGTPQTLFRPNLAQGGFVDRRFCPSRDGQRFLIDTPVGRSAAAQFAVTVGWTKDLKK